MGDQKEVNANVEQCLLLIATRPNLHVPIDQDKLLAPGLVPSAADAAKDLSIWKIWANFYILLLWIILFL